MRLEQEGPAAVAERLRSQGAYRNLSASQSLALFERAFSTQLRQLEMDHARIADELQVEKVLDEFTLRIRSEDGDPQLVSSSTPLVADTGGEESLVDLDLQRVGGDYMATNPLVPIRLPHWADQRIAVGSEGFSLTPLAAEAVPAKRLAGNLFYPNAFTDTDLLYAPIGRGMEIFAQLRSAAAPEALAYRVNVPTGGSLVSVEDGSVEIRRAGELIARIMAPHAADAQGRGVSTSMAGVGDELHLTIAHQGKDVAYPILLDPIVENWQRDPSDGVTLTRSWYHGYNYPGLGPWGWESGNAGRKYQSNESEYWYYQGQKQCFVAADGCGYSAYGLFNYVRPYYYYHDHHWGQWVYRAPGETTYLTYASLGPLFYDRYNLVPQQFYPYTGAWSETRGGWAQQGGHSWHEYGDPVPLYNYYDGYNTFPETDDIEWIVSGITTGEFISQSGQDYRSYATGGAFMHLEDREGASIPAAPVHSPALPSGWVDEQARTVSATAHDPGLGVSKQVLSLPAPGGGYATQQRQASCTGSAVNPCPRDFPNAQHSASPFSYNTNELPEGVNTAWLTAYDILNKVHTLQGQRAWNLNVDHTPPEDVVSGGLPDQDEPGTDLHVKVTDGDPSPTAAAQDKRSGVRRVEFLLDGQPVPASELTPPDALGERDCPQSSCSREFDYNAAGKLSDGEHTFTIRAWDQLGHQSPDKTFKVEIDRPTTGILDEYLMQYIDSPTDGNGNRDTEALAVNVVNGNLLYRHTDAHVQGNNIDLTIDRYYNSQLAESRGAFGNRWTLGGGADVFAAVQQSGDVMIHGPSAYEGLFERQQDGSLGPSRDVHASTLTRDGLGGYRLDFRDTGESLQFDSSGVLKSESTLTGASLEYAYGGGRLLSAHTSEGVEATFSYGPLNLFADIREVLIDGAAHTYEQDLLSRLARYQAPDGRAATYAYDLSNRLTEIRSLYGDTIGIAYDVQNRVISIRKQLPSGVAETTSFAYDSGGTVVTDPQGRAVTYRTGKAGVVTATHTNASTAPQLTLGGPAFDARGGSLPSGRANLSIQATTPTGIRSLEVQVDGAQMAYFPCTASCASHSATWALDTSSYLAGDAVVEVFATDEQGRERSRRFEVTMPETPEASDPPATPPTPQQRFDESERYRQRYSLSIDPPHIQATLQDPNLTASEEIYGVPLTDGERAVVDAHHLIDEEIAKVIEYGETHAQGSYAGTYVDHSAGGLVYVGFTNNSDEHLDAIAETFFRPELLRPFPALPDETRDELRQLSDRIFDDRAVLQATGVDVSATGVDIAANQVVVGMPAPSPQAEAALETRYQTDLRLTPHTGSLPYAGQPPVYGGALIRRQDHPERRCTIAFGARRRFPSLPFAVPRRGQPIFSHFLLTAGHCGPIRTQFLRGNTGNVLGEGMAENALTANSGQDAGVIQVSKRLATAYVRVKDGRALTIKKPQSASHELSGQEVCTYGAVSKDKVCGAVELDNWRTSLTTIEGTTHPLRKQRTWVPDRPGALTGGDSGAGIVQVRDNQVKAIGVFSHGVNCAQESQCTTFGFSHIGNVNDAFDTAAGDMNVLTAPPWQGKWPSL